MAKYPVIVGEAIPLKSETLGKKHFHYHNVYTRKDMSRYGYLFSVIANPLVQEEWIVSVIDQYLERTEKTGILMALKLTLRDLAQDGDFFIGIISHKTLFFAATDRYRAFLSRKDQLWHVNGDSNDRCHWEGAVQFGEYTIFPGDKIAVVSENIAEAVSERPFNDILGEYTIQVAARELSKRAYEQDGLGQSEVLTLTLEFSAPRIMIPWKALGVFAFILLLAVLVFGLVRGYLKSGPGGPGPGEEPRGDLPAGGENPPARVTYLQKNLPLEAKAAWEKRYGDSITASPAGTNDLLVIASKDTYIYAYPRPGAELLWRAPMAYEISASPLVDGDALYIGTFKGYLYRLSLETGKIEWKFKTGEKIVSRAVSDSEKVYFGSMDGYVYALVKESGKMAWRYPTKNPVWSAPALGEKTLYAASLDDHVYALDIRTGKSLWTKDLGDDIYSTPVLSEGVLYVGCDDHHLYAMDAASGTVLWSFTAEKEIGSKITAGKDALFFGAEDHNIYALDKKDGTLLWTFATGGVVRSGARLHDEILYIGSYDGALYALDAKKGELIWKGAVNGPVHGTPFVWGETVVAGDDSGLVRAFVTDLKQLKPVSLGE